MDAMSAAQAKTRKRAENAKPDHVSSTEECGGGSDSNNAEDDEWASFQQHLNEREAEQLPTGGAAAAPAAQPRSGATRDEGLNAVDYNLPDYMLSSSYSVPETDTFTVPKIPIRLFLQNLPRSYDEAAIKAILEPYCTVDEVVIIQDRSTGVSEGNAFVKVTSLTDADNAIAALSGKTVLDETGLPLSIRYATAEIEKLGIPVENAVPGVNETRLFIGSLSRQADEENIKALFSTICPVEEVYVIREGGTGASRGCAFAVLATKERALYAIKCLHGTSQLCASRPLEIRFAEIKSKSMQQQQQQQQVHAQAMNTVEHAAYPQSGFADAAGFPGPAAPCPGGPPEPRLEHAAVNGSVVPSSKVNAAPRRKDAWVEYFTDEGRPYYHNSVLGTSQWEKPPDFDSPGPPGANLFIFHVPSEWSLRELIYYFRAYGTIISATIATDRASGRNRGYAFVSYTDIASAVAAVKAMHGFSTGSKRLKVAIKQNEENYAAHLMQSGGWQQFSANNNGAAPGVRYASHARKFAAPY